MLTQRKDIFEHIQPMAPDIKAENVTILIVIVCALAI